MHLENRKIHTFVSFTALTTVATPLTRKRQRRPEIWKQNIRKALRQKGKMYENAKGQTVKAKEIGPTCKNTCFYNCSKLFSKIQREDIHQKFWDLSDDDKNIFYTEFVIRRNSKRRNSKTKNVESSMQKKKNFFDYYLKRQDLKTQVCKAFFLNTLGISERRIYYYFNNIHSEENGIKKPSKKSNSGRKKIAESKLNHIKEHIDSFPTIDSHYCRSNTSKKYLDSNLSIQKMYKLYCEKYSDGSVTYEIYRQVFNNKCNLSFYKPKKDQCDKCTAFKAIKNPTENEKKQYDMHIEENTYIKAERNLDRQNNEELRAIICYDLQNVFSLPKGFVSNFYYKRKFNVFNLTATVILKSKPNLTYCAIWGENMSGRSGNDLASALIKILKAVVKDNPTLKEIILWSDSCIPQNKNKITSTALLQFLNDSENIIFLTQKFSEPGHSRIQEVDCVHSAIERHLRGLEIPSPVKLLRFLTNLNYSNVRLKVIQMVRDDFFAFSKKAEELNFNLVPFSKCKILCYNKENPYTINYKNHLKDVSYQSAYLKKKVPRTTTAHFCKDIFSKPLVNLPPKDLPEDKIRDIKSMLPYLQEEDRSFYKVVLKIKD